MSYKREHYNAVFEAMKRSFGDEWFNRVYWARWGIIWRSQIKKLFDDGILIREIVSAIEEAKNKRMWPTGTGFFQRIRDSVLEQRRNAELSARSPIKTAKPESISELMQRRFTH